MSKYETIGGQVTRGETYAKIDHLLAEVEDLCAVMAHLHNTEGNHMDQLLAKGWLGTSGMMKKIRYQIQQLAMNKLQ